MSTHDAMQLMHAVYHANTEPLKILKQLFSLKKGTVPRSYSKGKLSEEVLVREKTGTNRGVNGFIGYFEAQGRAYAIAAMVTRPINPSEPASLSGAWMKSKSPFLRSIGDDAHAYFGYGIKSK